MYHKITDSIFLVDDNWIGSSPSCLDCSLSLFLQAHSFALLILPILQSTPLCLLSRCNFCARSPAASVLNLTTSRERHEIDCWLKRFLSDCAFFAEAVGKCRKNVHIRHFDVNMCLHAVSWSACIAKRPSRRCRLLTIESCLNHEHLHWCSNKETHSTYSHRLKQRERSPNTGRLIFFDVRTDCSSRTTRWLRFITPLRASTSEDLGTSVTFVQCSKRSPNHNMWWSDSQSVSSISPYLINGLKRHHIKVLQGFHKQ